MRGSRRAHVTDVFGQEVESHDKVMCVVGAVVLDPELVVEGAPEVLLQGHVVLHGAQHGLLGRAGWK
jgi:hypothetical protein